jgi:leucyl/phenylalanyl-tRNA--protein transferase
MFYSQPDASKAALVTLVRALGQKGYILFDCQQTTAHMVRFGGFEVPRVAFLSRLRRALELPFPRGPWGLRNGCLICPRLEENPMEPHDD